MCVCFLVNKNITAIVGCCRTTDAEETISEAPWQRNRKRWPRESSRGNAPGSEKKSEVTQPTVEAPAELPATSNKLEVTEPTVEAPAELSLKVDRPTANAPAEICMTSKKSENLKDVSTPGSADNDANSTGSEEEGSTSAPSHILFANSTRSGKSSIPAAFAAGKSIAAMP